MGILQSQPGHVNMRHLTHHLQHEQQLGKICIILQFIEVDSMVVLSTSVAAASRMFPVLANTSVSVAYVTTQLARLPHPCSL